MPSKSPAQARLMRAVAHGWKKPGGGGPTRTVAKEFVNADRRNKVQGYNFGGMAGGPRGALSAGMMKPGPGMVGRAPPPDPRLSGGQGGWRQPPQGGAPPNVMTGAGPQGNLGLPGMTPMMRQRMMERGVAGPMPVQQRQTQGLPSGALSQMGNRIAQMKQPGGGSPRMVPPSPRPGGQPMMGGLNQAQQMMQGRVNKRMPGQNVAPPPNKYPGGGHPNLGGRNPMMRQAQRYNPGMGGRGATSFFR